MKNLTVIIYLPRTPYPQEAASKTYVDNKFDDPRTKKNTAHFDLKDKNFDNARSLKIKGLPAVSLQVTSKLNVDNAMDDTTLVRNDKNNDFELLPSINVSHISFVSEPIGDSRFTTKVFVDS